MDDSTARYLNQLNAGFYSRNHDSFDRTRQAPWPGWSRLAGLLHGEWDIDVLPCSDKRRRVLDLACGNLRFEKFMQEEFPSSQMEFLAVDRWSSFVSDECFTDHVDPAPSAPGVIPVDLDVVDALLGDGVGNGMVFANNGMMRADRDLSVCFGFMHHLAGWDLRSRCLRLLVNSTRPGGLVAVSFWRFATDPKMRDKAEEATEQNLERLWSANLSHKLEPGDYLLGWQDSPDACRYCHSFSDDEVVDLVGTVADSYELVSAFRSDGRTGDLNAYVILRAG